MCGAMSPLLSHPKIFHSRSAHAKRNVMDSDATAPLDIFWDGVREGDTSLVGDVAGMCSAVSPIQIRNCLAQTIAQFWIRLMALDRFLSTLHFAIHCGMSPIWKRGDKMKFRTNLCREGEGRECNFSHEFLSPLFEKFLPKLFFPFCALYSVSHMIEQKVASIVRRWVCTWYETGEHEMWKFCLKMQTHKHGKLLKISWRAEFQVLRDSNRP